MVSPAKLSIYSYTSYREFLRDFFQRHVLDRGLSWRYASKKSGIKSPNYFQQVIIGHRNLTLDAARKFSQGFGLNQWERRYLTALVRLEKVANTDAADKELAEMRRLVVAHGVEEVKNDSMSSHWLHGVVWALAATNGFVLTAENVQGRIGGIATVVEIKASIDFLKLAGLLHESEEPGVYQQSAVKFSPTNDVRRIDLQRNHLRFLDLAKLRLHDPLDQREYQGLSIPKARFKEVKDRVRKFVQGLAEELSHHTDADMVLRLQCCAFWVTREKLPDEANETSDDHADTEIGLAK